MHTTAAPQTRLARPRREVINHEPRGGLHRFALLGRALHHPHPAPRRPIGQVTYASRLRLTDLAPRFEGGPAGSPERSSSCRGRAESGPSARVLLAGSTCPTARVSDLRRAPKNAMLRPLHDELTNCCRIAQLFRPPFRNARARAEISRPGSGDSRPSRRNRRAEALPRAGVLLDVRLLRRRARLFRGRRLQPDPSRPRRTTLAGDPGGGPLGAGASGRATRARATPDPRQPGKGFGGGGRQVEAPDRRAGRASLAAAAGSHCGAKASRPPQPPTRSVTRILVRRRHAGGATRVAPCSRVRTASAATR